MTTPTKIQRNGKLEWVAVADIHVSPVAQRELRPGWAAQIANDFDPDRFTPPLVSRRDGKLYVIDGQHRFAAMHMMGWDDQLVEAWVHDGLTEAEEADLFLWHNNRKAVHAMDRFQVSVIADRPAEVDIDAIVRKAGLSVSTNKDGIRAVGALTKVYAFGPDVLARTLLIIRDSYGLHGFKWEVIEGLGLLIARFGHLLDDTRMIDRLGSVSGGVNGLINPAHALKKQLGRPLGQCVAGAAVQLLNSGRRGRAALPNWWS